MCVRRKRIGFKRVARGVTILEMLIVMACVAVLVALLLPAVRFSGDAAQRMQCSFRLKQLGLACHNYEAAHGVFPSSMAGTSLYNDQRKGNADRLSGVVALLPFLERDDLWNRISEPLVAEDFEYPAMGPAPWVSEYPPWQQSLPELRCPTNAQQPSSTSFAFSVGDQAYQLHAPEAPRGAFACGVWRSLRDISDGTSNTVGMTEIGNPAERRVEGLVVVRGTRAVLVDPRTCTQLGNEHGLIEGDAGWPLRPRGRNWADGAANSSLVQMILPPNQPSCAIADSATSDGLYSAGSYHEGGCNTLMMDGAVHFVSSSIDWGAPGTAVPRLSDSESQHRESPFGVWGALGSASAGEEGAVVP